MSIGSNIAIFRKEKGFTQEDLGEKLGVTNQAVSKWESEISMPDIMLLPCIAETLGVTINALYGIDDEKNKVIADEFPQQAYLQLFKYFYQQCGVKFSYIDRSDDVQLSEWIREIDNGRMLGCISDIAGGVVISRNCAVIDTDYKKPGSESIFDSKILARVLRDLSDDNCRKVLMYQYKSSFVENDTSDMKFSLKDICDGCGLSEEDTFDALEKLTSLKLETKWTNNAHQVEYYFEKSIAIYALEIFKIAEIMVSEQAWHVIRDSSMISDYTFEKLWK